MSEEEYIARMWARGKGYYGAHEHTAAPRTWDEFRESAGEDAVGKARYELYMVSWIMHHGRQPAPEELHPELGGKILARVEQRLQREVERIAEATGKKKKKKRRA